MNRTDLGHMRECLVIVNSVSLSIALGMIKFNNYIHIHPIYLTKTSKFYLCHVGVDFLYMFDTITLRVLDIHA